MKLTILEMQVLELVMSRLEIKYQPWYSFSEGLFKPVFFDSKAKSGWIVRDESTPKNENLYLGRLPLLFKWSLEYSDLNELKEPLEIVDEILKNKRTHQSEFDKPGSLPDGVDQQVVANMASVIFRDHLQLDFVSLDQPCYDLVGFEQN